MRRLPARASFLIRRGVGSMIATAGTREAAQVAFFLLVSFPAALLLVIWGLSTALDDVSVRDRVLDGVIDALPLTDAEGRTQIEGLLDGVADGAGALGLITVIALIWSASATLGALRHSIVAAWKDGTPLPYFQGKALDIGLTLLVAPLLLATLALNLVRVVPNALGDRPLLEGLGSLLLTGIVPGIALFITLLVLYRVQPTGESSWRAAWPGALVAVIGAGIVRLGAEAYFRTVGGDDAIYGAIAGLLAVSVSVYLLSIVAVFGANISAEMARYPDNEALDAEIELEAETAGPAKHAVLDALRSLFVRRRPRG